MKLTKSLSGHPTETEQNSNSFVNNTASCDFGSLLDVSPLQLGATATLPAKPKVTARSPPVAKTYQCDSCSTKFLAKKTLKAHNIGGICANSSGAPAPRPKDEHSEPTGRKEHGPKLFACKACPNAYTRVWALKCHMRSHTGERPFSCDVCRKTFMRATSLWVHKKIHVGARRFHCGQCDKTFLEKCKLDRHSRTHAGLRPFGCAACAKTFGRKDDRDKHAKNQHFRK